MGISRRPKDKSAGNAPSGGRGAGGGKPNIKKAAFDTTKKKEVGVSDLTLLSKVSNEAINENLKKRFENGEIYTYIGHVLVSVNPFRDLGIYTDAVLDSYKGKNRLEMPPHVYAVAESSYYNMNAYKDNQCVIISGESGAGKTEAAKRIMQYIANVSGGKDSSIQEIKDMVLATNPLLESFGNAKTLRNNNSSRFGKYLQLQFNSAGEPVGADITNYLLEKSRVVGQIMNERNFHIFYQFTKGASQKYRETFGVQKPETYVYTSKSKCFDVDGIDDLAEFQDTLNAMKIIGLSQAEQDEIFRILAAILWTGNIHFVEDKDGYAAIADQSVVDFLAYLLEVDAAHVVSAITIRILTPRNGEVIESPANPAQAAATRDGLAKALYNNLFDWIVERVNVSLKARGATSNSIGILDIYGFEIFEKNSFEQLCINYVNEKLQQIFIQLTLKTEQEEYAREQIKWTPIQYFDNKIVCDLIEGTRPPGIFSAMKDATRTAHADPAASDRTFMQSINGMSNPHLTPRQGNFIVKHYAGDVSYTVEGITDKNKDQLLKGLLNLFAQSQNEFVHTLFPNEVNQDDRRQPPAAGDKIKTSANELVATLMKATPSYIRTIKPNENKSFSEYNVPNVMHQIKYLGLQENVRIRRAGFAYRQTYDKFVERFYLLSPQCSYAGEYTWTGDSKSGAKQILKDTSIPAEEYQFGVTKAFIKAPETLFALEHMRDRYWHNMAIRIQRVWRAYLRIRSEAATRIQRVWRKKRVGAEFLEMRERGHKLLQGRKERRRMSLLGSRRFMGDYLGCNAGSGPGARVLKAFNIPGNEVILFSCRGEVLESKFGRSSKPSPRIFVLTKSRFYVVLQAVVNKQVQISAERAIPLGSIKFIGLSTSRDDWFSLGIGSSRTSREPHRDTGSALLKISDHIAYAKKPGKMTDIKVLRDSQQREDFYKSGAIHTQSGEPPNSVSRPLPKGKPIPAKPFTKGRLIRPGGPAGRPHQPVAQNPIAHAPVAAHNPLAQQLASRTRALPQQPQEISLSQYGAIAAASHAAPAPAATCAMYDFEGQSANELSFKKDEVVDIVQKENNGWWLAKINGREGWAPSAYLKEETPPPPPRSPARPPAANGKPKPPAPPAKRPAAGGRKAAALPGQRDSGGMASGNEGGGSGRSTPSLGGGVAEALRARQSAMNAGHGGRDEDDW
ncbi:hypothetical protein VE04_03195 [Pseudogymnoascus sp. 24MN13]|nr:hypothetical protein VE04_03195 [Pseudogymnoascus sp. 24MN13]